ncbi:hypothetical protein [Achromobacter spanius]|uniref:hypothetical protein n=1 Tax=Achromobacter spanius TaxID=217203 RepID=UPI003209F2F9
MPFRYLNGWREFFDLSRLMAIGQGIVYGLESKKVDALMQAIKLRRAAFTQPLASEGRTNAAALDFDFDGGRALKLLFIRHPSTFFSWRKWAPVIRDHFPSQFQVGGKSPESTA